MLTMSRDEAREYIKENISCLDYLEKSPKGKDFYICPHCGSGTGENQTGAVRYYPETNTCYCFSCNKSNDIIDLVMVVEGLDYNAAFGRLCEKEGIQIASKRQNSSETTQHGNNTPEKEKTENRGTEADYTHYYEYCIENLKNSPEAISYLNGRGISIETAVKHHIGFDVSADPANAPGVIDDDDSLKKHPTPRIIVPTKKSHYATRAISPTIPKNYAKLNCKGDSPGIFNKKALDTTDSVIFAVEGFMDALSIEEVGGVAIALNSTSNAKKFIDIACKKSDNDNVYILLLDDDNAGKEATEKIKAKFDEIGIDYVENIDICNGENDPNDALCKDKERFQKAVHEVIKQSSEMAVDAVEDHTTEYFINHLMGYHISEMQNMKPVNTGFKNFDEFTEGGLYPGLYVLGANTGLGKTTFCLQMADNIATFGNHVIFFSLEMSEFELVSKSLTRRIHKYGIKSGIASLGIRYGRYQEETKNAAVGYLQDVGNRITIIEGSFDTTVSVMREKVNRYIKSHKIKPVVFVDYLQVIKPDNDVKPGTKKDSIDDIIVELKRMSREYNITVIVISSLNRANYMLPVSPESFKESGNIEYTVDVLLGLQLQCLGNEKVFEKDEKKAIKRKDIDDAMHEDIRKLELKILKNRFGRTTRATGADNRIFLDYNPKYDYMEDGHFNPPKEKEKDPNRKRH